MYKKRFSFLFITIVLFMISHSSLAMEKDTERQTLSKKETLTREKSLTVNLKYGNGYITIGKSDPQNIYEGEFSYRKYRPDIKYDIVNNEGRLDIFFTEEAKGTEENDRKGDFYSFNDLYENELSLNFNPHILLNFNIDLGVSKGNMDFSGLKIRKLFLEMGVSKTGVKFDEINSIGMESFRVEDGVGKFSIENLGNANVSDFSFEGGVGSYQLDFRGNYQQNLTGKIELGMGKLILYLPRNIATRLSVDKSFFSALEIDEVFKNGNIYTNERWGKSEPTIDLFIESGMGKIEVVWVD